MKLVKKKIDPREMQKGYFEKVEKELTSKGVILYDPLDGTLNISSEYLALPSEITEVSSKDLGEYLNAFTQQKMYMRILVGRQELITEEAKRKYYHTSDPIYKALSESKMSETAKERLINSDERVTSVHENYIEQKQKLGILNYSIDNIESAVFMLSREIARRDSDFKGEYRNESIQRK